MSLFISLIILSVQTSVIVKSACSYTTSGDVPLYPLNVCLFETSTNGVTRSAIYSCDGSFKDGTEIQEMRYNNSDCSDNPFATAPYFTIGDSGVLAATGCNQTCETIATVRTTSCTDSASCAQNCDGNFVETTYILDECYTTNIGSEKYYCTPDQVFVLSYSDSLCTENEMQKGDAFAVEGCGTGAFANRYIDIKDCPFTATPTMTPSEDPTSPPSQSQGTSDSHIYHLSFMGLLTLIFCWFA